MLSIESDRFPQVGRVFLLTASVSRHLRSELVNSKKGLKTHRSLEPKRRRISKKMFSNRFYPKLLSALFTLTKTDQAERVEFGRRASFCSRRDPVGRQITATL